MKAAEMTYETVYSSKRAFAILAQYLIGLLQLSNYMLTL